MKIGLLVFVTLMIGLLGAGYFFVFKPANEKRMTRVADVETKKRALADLRASTAGISDLEHKVDELQKAIRFFESKLPQEKEIDNVLREVWQLAEQNSLTTKTVKTLKTERMSGYAELPVQVGLSGDFRGFYKFMLELERLPRITRVTQMKLEKISSREGEMNATMTLCIYFESGALAPTAAGM